MVWLTPQYSVNYINIDMYTNQMYLIYCVLTVGTNGILFSGSSSLGLKRQKLPLSINHHALKRVSQWQRGRDQSSRSHDEVAQDYARNVMIQSLV